MGAKMSLIIKRLHRASVPEELIESTSFSREEIRSLYQAFLADCPRGSLTSQQFQSIYADFFPRAAKSDSFAKHLFRSFDRNNDGRLDFVEFAIALSTTQRGSEEEKLEWIFRVYDVDGNGVITQNEVTEVLQALDLLSKCEQYTPGSSSAIGSCRSCDIGHHLEAKEGEQRARELFLELDTDRNGLVTREEFFEAARRNPELIGLLST